jgi:hypothetical protein
MTPTALVGAFLTAIMAGVSYRLWGEPAAIAAGVFGLIAMGIQLAALALMKPVRGAPLSKFIGRWGAGMALRGAGILAVALAAGLDQTHFPPLATALGFLGVLLPLLFYEVRLIR